MVTVYFDSSSPLSSRTSQVAVATGGSSPQPVEGEIRKRNNAPNTVRIVVDRKLAKRPDRLNHDSTLRCFMQRTPSLKETRQLPDEQQILSLQTEVSRISAKSGKITILRRYPIHGPWQPATNVLISA